MDTDNKFTATFGAKAALNPTINITITTKVTKPFIWLLKCRYIWAVIRAKVEATS